MINENRIDCKGLYNEVVKEIVQDIESYNIKPEYTCYIIKDENGEVDPASEIYTSLKHKSSEEAGVVCNIKKITEDEFLNIIYDLYMKDEPERAILQLPAPDRCVVAYSHMVEDGYIIDVDYLTNTDYTNMCLGNFNNSPATPRGIVALLSEELGSISGKKISVIGARSKTTGKYLVPMLIELGATVVAYTSRSIIKPLEFAECDAIVSCVGKPDLIDPSHLGFNKPVLIDVGVSRVEGKVKGDFHLSCRGIARYTPFINGVGLITRGFLLRNVVDSYIADLNKY